jgi:hypothetical protein
MQMDEKHNQLNSQLALSRNNSLAIIKSGLVKRGLELSNEIKKRRVRVLIGDHSWEHVGPVISDYIQKQLSKNYVLQFESLFRSEEIIEHAKNGSVDIFILILNNIYPSIVSPNIVDRLNAGLRISSQIKKQYMKPVIALSGWTEGAYIERAKSVSHFFFPLPCKLDELMIAFDKCLKMLPEFDETAASQYLQER